MKKNTIPAIVPQFNNTAKGKKTKLACLHNCHDRIARHAGRTFRFIVQHLGENVMINAVAIDGPKCVVDILNDTSDLAKALKVRAENRLYS